jgi:hypothetical protein
MSVLGGDFMHGLEELLSLVVRDMRIYPVNSYGPFLSTTSKLYSSSTSPFNPGYVNLASNFSPAFNGPTPAGVPVRIRSPSCPSVHSKRCDVPLDA